MKFPKASKKTLIIIVVTILVLTIGILVLTNKNKDTTEIPTTPTPDNTPKNTPKKTRAQIINQYVGDIGKGYQIYLLEKKTATRFNDNVLNYLKSLTVEQIKDLNKMSLEDLKRYASRIL